MFNLPPEALANLVASAQGPTKSFIGFEARREECSAVVLVGADVLLRPCEVTEKSLVADRC